MRRIKIPDEDNRLSCLYILFAEKYERKGYVTSVIGKPFKVGDMTLEEANNKLYKEILKCMLEAKKIHKEKYNK